MTMTYIGNPWPKLFGGFTNTFTYKGFDLSVLITGTYGNDIYNYMAKENSNPNNINLKPQSDDACNGICKTNNR